MKKMHENSFTNPSDTNALKLNKIDLVDISDNNDGL